MLDKVKGASLVLVDYGFLCSFLPFIKKAIVSFHFPRPVRSVCRCKTAGHNVYQNCVDLEVTLTIFLTDAVTRLAGCQEKNLRRYHTYELILIIC